MQGLYQSIINEHTKYSEDAKKLFSIYHNSALKAEALSPFVAECEYNLKYKLYNDNAFCTTINNYYNKLVELHLKAMEFFNSDPQNRSNYNQNKLEDLQLKIIILRPFYYLANGNKLEINKLDITQEK